MRGKGKNRAHASVFWRGILFTKEFFTAGVMLRVGSGKCVSFCRHIVPAVYGVIK